MKYASITFALGLLASGLASRPAVAATATASFSVTAMVVSGCQVSAPDLPSDRYAASGGNATSSVAVTCTKPTPYDVSVGAAEVTGEAVTTGKASSPASTLPGVALLSNPAHPVKADKTAALEAMVRTGIESYRTQSTNVPASGIRSGATSVYADSVTITITY